MNPDEMKHPRPVPQINQEAVDEACREMRRCGEIERTLAALRRVWYRFPQLRLGQLIVDVLPEGQSDPFYVTDVDMALYLNHFNPNENKRNT